jgi:hypothetical protein
LPFLFPLFHQQLEFRSGRGENGLFGVTEGDERSVLQYVSTGSAETSRLQAGLIGIL